MLTKLTTKYRLATLLILVVLGLSLRLRGLGSIGFNEDEVLKVLAGRSYLRGEFSTNLEHPMLMKSLIAISLAGSDVWNSGLGQRHQVSEEASVRLPNAIFGALTAVVIFLLAQELLGTSIGLLSALLWTTGTIAITVNRVAKEDTLLVFFTCLGYYLYLRAKNLTTIDGKQVTRFCAASGASFGVMLASKYFPHYFGLNALYYVLCERGKKGQELGKRNLRLLVGACAATLIVFNPIVVVPSTLAHFVHYVGGSTVTHHGYLVMGQLYREDFTGVGGMPMYFYLLMLAIKTPIPILAGLAVGLIEAWKHRSERGPAFALFMFIFWIVPFSLVGPKWLRYMLAWMPAVYIIAAIGLVKIWSWVSALAAQRRSPRLAPVLATAFLLVFVIYPAGAAANSGPYYSLYLNAFGQGRTGYYFPHDEVNDMGLQSAAQYISKEASYGASVSGEARPVFQYYFHKYGRDDLQYSDISDRAQGLAVLNSDFLVLQDGRTYFENVSVVRRLESSQMPVQRVEIGGADAARVYRTVNLAAASVKADL